jgi:hypothetical protein
MDLSSDANSVLYTSDGSTIRRLQVNGSGAGTVTTFATVEGESFTAIRVLPVCSLCSSGSGVLVAGKSAVSLFDAGGSLVKTFAITGNSLAVDPPVQIPLGSTQPPSFFWIATSGSGTFSRVSLASGGVTSFSVPSVTAINSISVYGGFGANQPLATVFPPVQLAGSPSNSAVFFFRSADQLTLTGYGFPSGFETDVQATATSVPAQTATNDLGEPCTPTISGECTVWEISLDNPLPEDALLMLKIFAEQGGVNANSRIYRNSRDNLTSGIRNIDPMASSRISVYTLNQIAGTDEGCQYFPPVVEGATLNNPGNVTFRFQCSGLPGSALRALSPRISILQIRSGAAPRPFFPGIGTLTGGTCCTVANYRYDATSNTWVLNVSFKGVATQSTFLVTTFDDNQIASAFDVQFTVNK